MSQCLNCGSNLGCSCQKRVASDGKSVCANCISVYEANINSTKTNILTPNNGTSPTNVNVFYKAP